MPLHNVVIGAGQEQQSYPNQHQAQTDNQHILRKSAQPVEIVLKERTIIEADQDLAAEDQNPSLVQPVINPIFKLRHWYVVAP